MIILNFEINIHVYGYESLNKNKSERQIFTGI